MVGQSFGFQPLSHLDGMINNLLFLAVTNYRYFSLNRKFCLLPLILGLSSFYVLLLMDLIVDTRLNISKHGGMIFSFFAKSIGMSDHWSYSLMPMLVLDPLLLTLETCTLRHVMLQASVCLHSVANYICVLPLHLLRHIPVIRLHGTVTS